MGSSSSKTTVQKKYAECEAKLPAACDQAAKKEWCGAYVNTLHKKHWVLNKDELPLDALSVPFKKGKTVRLHGETGCPVVASSQNVYLGYGGRKYDTMKVKELRECCAKRKIKYSGLKKAELIATLKKTQRKQNK